VDGRPRRISDLTSEAEYLEAHPLTRSALCVPLKVGERVIGVINAESRRQDAFSAADERLLATFASQLATAIEKVRLMATLEQRVADRTRELLALYHVTTVASQSLDLNTALEQSLERVLAAMRSNVGAIQLVDETGELLHLAVQQGIPPDVAAQMDAVPSGDSLAGWVMKHGEPLIVPNIGTDPRVPQAAHKGGLLSYVGVPMRVGGRTLGVLSMFGEAGLPFNVEEVALLSSVADQVGVVMENTRLRQLAEEAAVMKERDRLARELHDSVTQSLYSLTLFAEAGRELIKAGDLGRVEHHLARIGETAQQSLKEMRLLVHELRPPVLERDGLVGALHQRLDAVERRAGVEARLLVEELVELPPTVEEGLYRIAQEALNNALKHAAATSVTVHLRTDGGRVELEVIDNGRGFDPKAVSDKGGMGLISMRERAEKLGGSLTVLSVPGEGTRVKVSVKRET
jgi:signal transduction histidine kinase